MWQSEHLCSLLLICYCHTRQEHKGNGIIVHICKYICLFYADDLVVIAESMEELAMKLEKWRKGMESKDLRMNTKKTKVMICGYDEGPVLKSDKWPCRGVGKELVATPYFVFSAVVGFMRAAVAFMVVCLVL